jgi:soluble lytic murein transglycosylase-like protein
MYFEITDVWFGAGPPPSLRTTLRRWGGLLSLAAALVPVMPAQGSDNVPAPVAAAPVSLPLGDPWEAVVVEPAPPGEPGPWQAAVTEADGHPVAAAAPRSQMADLVPASRRFLRPVLIRYAEENGLPADLVMALAWKESSWRPKAVSGAGAVGVMQLMPATVEFASKTLLGLSRRLDPRDPVANIRMGTVFLRHLVDHNKSSFRRALIAYNQGQTSLHSRGSNRSSERFADQVLALRSRFRETGR